MHHKFVCRTNGYQVKVSEEVELVWNVPEERIATIPNSGDILEPTHYTKSSPTGTNMSLLLVGELIMSGKEVAVISNSGNIVGAGRFNRKGVAGFAVWGDDLTTDVKDGLISGESYHLKVWDDNLDRELSLDFSVDKFGSKLEYNTDRFIMLEVSLSDFVPEEYFLSNAYPNPFNSITRIDFGLPEAGEVGISVYDLSGRNVATLISGEEVAGRHTVVWNAIGHASGVYILEMKAANYTAVHKLAFVK